MEALSQVRIGTAGWSYKDWEGIMYPAGMQRKNQHPLEVLAQCFDMVEVNTSFYGHIRPELAKLWGKKVAAVNTDFVFTAKLHRSFTHSPLAIMEPTSAATIRPSDEDERLAREGLDALANTGKFGALLIQFPVSFKNTSLNREYVEALLRQFIEFPRVIEVRHDSWNNPETLSYFIQKNVAFCNIDQPVIGRSLEPTEHVTAPLSYVRLHGRNYDQWFDSETAADRYNYLYSTPELKDWAGKIERIAGRTEVTYVVANNHLQAKAAVNALQLKNLLGHQRVRAPFTLLQHYPELKTIADPLPEASSSDNLALFA